MAELRTGTVVDKAIVSATLMRFRLAPAAGARFPDYEAGQYIALRRDDCKLTRRAGVGSDGKPICEPEYDPWGRQTVGPVTQPYSIASAPADTAEHGWLEFLVAIEHGVHGLSGRLSEVLFGTGGETGGEVRYHDRIAGGFTLSARAGDAASVLMVGTGTGVAPFVSMIRELRARDGGGDTRRYTLIHTARTEAELAYDAELFEIEAAGRFDFLYLPTVSRPPQGVDPSRAAGRDPRIGLGRPATWSATSMAWPPQRKRSRPARSATSRKWRPSWPSSGWFVPRFPPMWTRPSSAPGSPRATRFCSPAAIPPRSPTSRRPRNAVRCGSNGTRGERPGASYQPVAKLRGAPKPAGGGAETARIGQISAISTAARHVLGPSTARPDAAPLLPRPATLTARDGSPPIRGVATAFRPAGAA